MTICTPNGLLEAHQSPDCDDSYNPDKMTERTVGPEAVATLPQTCTTESPTTPEAFDAGRLGARHAGLACSEGISHW